MRVLNLWLSDFKNLRDFEISFSTPHAVTVLVGRNGTGESNILEALTLIYRDLDLGNAASITFHVLYECRGSIIRVAGKAGERNYDVVVDGAPVPSSKFLGEEGWRWKPDFVFGYYSGPSNRLERHFAQHQERFYRDLIRGVEKPMRRLFYARTVHSNFVLLAFFLEQDANVQKLLRDHLGIVSLDSVLFEMREPTWTSRSGDSRFWNARGTVQEFLEHLYVLSLAPLRLRVRSKGERRRKAREHLYLFLPSIEEVRELRSKHATDQEFFKALESTYISELIHDVRIRVGLRKSGVPLTFRELSEGEQQLLLVLGLMRFTREDESLFLLDEPDTHLNPAWSVQYRRFLEEFGGLSFTSHVLMATHDPLVISSLVRDEVRILERMEDGRVRAVVPREDPQGMGVGNLLTSDIYGLPASLDLVTLEKIVRKRVLAARDQLTPAEIVELRELAASLRDLDFLAEDRDPDFSAYVRARYGGKFSAETVGPRSQREVEEERLLAEELVKEVLDRDRESRLRRGDS